MDYCHTLFDLTGVDTELVTSFIDFLKTTCEPNNGFIRWYSKDYLTVVSKNSVIELWHFGIHNNPQTINSFVPNHLFEPITSAVILLNMNIGEQLLLLGRNKGIVLHETASNFVYEKLLIPNAPLELTRHNFIIIPPRLLNSFRSDIDSLVNKLFNLNGVTPSEGMYLIFDITLPYMVDVSFRSSKSISNLYTKFKNSLDRFFVFEAESFRKFLEDIDKQKSVSKDFLANYPYPTPYRINTPIKSVFTSYNPY